MNKQIQKILINVNKTVDNIKVKYGHKPKGMPAREVIRFETDDLIVQGYELPDITIETKIYSRFQVLNQAKSQWGKYLGQGRWGRDYVLDESDFKGSDLKYHVMNLASAKDVFNLANSIIRHIFKAIWTPEIFDCDDFMKLFMGIVSLILFKAGFRNAGVGIAMIKVDWRDKDDDNKLKGHALNCCPIFDKNEDLKWYLVESQSGRIYDFPEGYEIHFFDM